MVGWGGLGDQACRAGVFSWWYVSHGEASEGVVTLPDHFKEPGCTIGRVMIKSPYLRN